MDRILWSGPIFLWSYTLLMKNGKISEKFQIGQKKGKIFLVFFTDVFPPTQKRFFVENKSSFLN